jgi:lactate dehydrogenase-like 2-hydroxyacid dehydrogenase
VVTNGHTLIDTALLDRLPNLGAICASSAGYDMIDVHALKERGIRLTNTSIALLDDVADLALLLILATRRDLIRAHEYVTSGDWGREGMYPLQSAIRGKRLGIVGMGRIGQAIARRAGSCGFDIAYFGRSRKPGIDYPFHPDLIELARWTDVMAVSIAGGPDTQNLISAEVIDALGPTGTLVNVSRGTVVDEEALIAALKQGTLGNAGLDVFLNEPDPDPRLTVLPNVTLYPHHASGTVETRDAMAQLVVDNLAAFFAGDPLVTPVL